MHGYPPVELYVPTGFFIMIAVIVAINVLAQVWSKGRELAAMCRLKERMIDRGMSAEEIERVIMAGTGKALPPSSKAPIPPAKPYPSPVDWPAHSHN